MTTGKYKAAAVVFSLMAGLIQPVSAVLFSQDFSGSAALREYAANSPEQNQFTVLPGTGAAGTASIENGAYKFVKTGSGNMGLTRAVDLVGSPAAAMKFSFDLNLSGFTTPALTRLITGVFSSAGGNFTAFGIDSNGDGTWRFANNTALTFTGTQRLTFVLNDSGKTITYTAPDGSSETLADAAWEVWVETTKVTNDTTAGVNAENDLSRFQVNMQNLVEGQTTTFIFDNFTAESLSDGAEQIKG
jgi:hypothetical protein